MIASERNKSIELWDYDLISTPEPLDCRSNPPEHLNSFTSQKPSVRAHQNTFQSFSINPFFLINKSFCRWKHNKFLGSTCQINVSYNCPQTLRCNRRSEWKGSPWTPGALLQFWVTIIDLNKAVMAMRLLFYGFWDVQRVEQKPESRAARETQVSPWLT